MKEEIQSSKNDRYANKLNKQRDAVQDAIGFLGCTLAAHVRPLIHQDPIIILSQAVLDLFIPILCWNQGLPWHRCSTLYLILWSLMRFLWAHFSSFFRSLWVTPHPTAVWTALLSLVSFTNLLRVHLMPLSVPLMKTLYSAAPSIDTWGTPLVTGVPQDPEPLPYTFCMIYALFSSTEQSTHPIKLAPI